MLRKIIAVACFALLGSLPAYAQATVEQCFRATPTGFCNAVDAANPLPVAATASIAGFTPGGTYANLTATGSSASVALPAGTTVVFQNVGTTAVSCVLGVGSATAVANRIIVQPSSSRPVVVGANTFGACIDQTGSASNLVVLMGGSGLDTGYGGGSSSGGGGGAITAASGSYASGAMSAGSYAAGALAAGAFATGAGVDGWDLSVGATTAAAATAGGAGTVQAKLRLLTSQIDTLNTNVTASIPAGTAYIGMTRPTDGTRNAVIHPCEAAIQTYAPISITTATTTRIVAPSASNKTYICSLLLTSAAADNVGIVEGTGGTCGSGTAGVIGGTTAANGPNFAANGGLFIQAGGKVSVANTAGTNVDLCLITSAATPLAGGINYVQAP